MYPSFRVLREMSPKWRRSMPTVEDSVRITYTKPENELTAEERAARERLNAAPNQATEQYVQESRLQDVLGIELYPREECVINFVGKFLILNVSFKLRRHRSSHACRTVPQCSHSIAPKWHSRSAPVKRTLATSALGGKPNLEWTGKSQCREAPMILSSIRKPMALM
jgi:hypothetical protein